MLRVYKINHGFARKRTQVKVIGTSSRGEIQEEVSRTPTRVTTNHNRSVQEVLFFGTEKERKDRGKDKDLGNISKKQQQSISTQLKQT